VLSSRGEGYEAMVAAACGEMMVIFSCTDGDSRMEALAALQPMAGAIESARWDKAGLQLACLCERQVVVYRRNILAAEAHSWEVAARIPSAGASAVGWICGESEGDADSLAIARQTLDVHHIPASSAYSYCAPAVECDYCLPLPGASRRAGDGARARRLSHLAMSADRQWLASTCHMGRIVTVTQIGCAKDDGGGLQGRTILLAHPRAVCSVAWMPHDSGGGGHDAAKGSGQGLAVLLTACQDGLVRISRRTTHTRAHTTHMQTQHTHTQYTHARADTHTHTTCPAPQIR
jgi:hypothetical protein